MVTPGLYIRLIEREQRGIFCSRYFNRCFIFHFPSLNLFTFRPQIVTFCPIIAEGRRGGGVFFFWGTVTRLLSPLPLIYIALLYISFRTVVNA